MGRETEELKLGGSGLWDKALKIEKLYQMVCAPATLIIIDKLPTKETNSFCCCISSDHKFSSLNNTHGLSQFMWVRSVSMAWLDHLTLEQSP